ncbi:hypothetical protein NXS19_007909 [Fusarium pseudograminearum]|nr:hypothetical protein NXS19_007909 [Fusarium pseudograminearum]
MDIEMATTASGFPGLAQNIASTPDYETFIFRKFDRLSARNLLHLESRLAYLEWKLDRADEQAMQSQDNETLRSMRAWEAFEENAKDQSRAENARMAIAEEIKKTLGEYRDLIALRRLSEKDPLSRFLQDHWRFKTTKLANNTEHIKEKHVAWAAAAVSTFVAAVLLLGAIFSLRLLGREDAQLGLIAMFTILFAASISGLTNARRAEIFASTAAYAAVLVVFVSSSPSVASIDNCTCIKKA